MPTDNATRGYTWGIAGRADDTVYLFNMPESQARQIAILDPTFKAVPISTLKYPVRHRV